MQAASFVARPHPPVQAAPPPCGALEPQRDTKKRTSYQVSPGGIEVTDLRQLTHGPIVPNSVVDLYLPIIGYDGLGILTALYRLATADGRVRTRTKLDTFARAGRLGFRRFSQLLDLLHDLSIIAVRKPTGAARSAHFHTEITLLDPPTAVPEALAGQVLDRTLTPWLVAPTQSERPTTPPDGDAPTSHPTIPELSPNSSSSCHLTILELSDSSSTVCTRQQVVPLGNEPIGGKQGRAGNAAPRRAATHSNQAASQHEVDEIHTSSANQLKVSLRDLWNQHAARPWQADDTRLQQLSDEFGDAWVAAAITSLGERAPIFKLDAVRITLDRWRRENSWGSPAPQRARPVDQRRPSRIAADDTRRTHPVVERFVAMFGHSPSSDQADAMIAQVRDDGTWARTLHDWRLNGHRPHNVAGLLDNYAKRRPSAVVVGGLKSGSNDTVILAVSDSLLADDNVVAGALWNRVQQHLQESITADEFDAWIRPATLVHTSEETVIIAAGNVFARDKLLAEYQGLFEAAFSSELQQNVAVIFVIN